jgi:hypothetical protein
MTVRYEEKEPSTTGQFALACEEMNEYARLLRESSLFGTVRTGADIRCYETGWRLEKWVEAELDKDEGLWAVWWLEFGPTKNGWIIESHLGINPDVLFVGLESRSIESLRDFEQHLSAAVRQLKGALEQDGDFAREVRKRARENH